MKSVAESLDDYGFVVVPGMIDDDLISHMQILSHHIFGILDQISRSPAEDESEAVLRYIRDFYDKYDFITQDALDGHLSRYELPQPQGFARFGSRVQRLLVEQYGVHTEGFLPARSVLRRQRVMPGRAPGYVPWHRDIHAVGTHADLKSVDARTTVNIWIPMCAVGDGAPSLDVRPGSHRIYRQIPVPMDGADLQAEVCSDEVLAGAAFYTPALNLGDVLIFDHQLIHRTQKVANQTRERISLELRFAL